MAKPKDPAVRTQLLERAAHMLAAREPITLRSLVAGTGVSTMAVYTHFGGMDGMWRALRQEGFTLLAARFSTLRPSTDSVRDLTALVAAYLDHALEHPNLYRVMFDPSVDLEDLEAADETLGHLVEAVRRAQDAGRFNTDVPLMDFAVQCWVIGHGLGSLVATGPLPVQALEHGTAMLIALFISAGDHPDACRSSVRRGWRRQA